MTGIVCALPGVIKPSAPAVEPVRTVAATFTDVGNAARSSTQAKFGTYSYVFDGSGDETYTSNKNYMEFITGDFTLECFMRADTLHQGVLMCQQDSNSGWCFFVNSDGKIHFQQINTSGGFIAFSGYASKWTTNTWHHIAFVREGTGVATYIDGSRDYNSTSSARPTATTGDCRIGNGKVFESGGFNSGDLCFDGYIDEVRISNIARYTGSSYTVPTSAFVNDANTCLLMHMETDPPEDDVS